MQPGVAVPHTFDTRPFAVAGYMVVQPVPRETFVSMPGGGRSYLFDLGTGMYASGSLPWFLDTYANRDITFDEIFGAGRWRFALQLGTQDRGVKGFVNRVTPRLHHRSR